jgi:hypothetical protein
LLGRVANLRAGSWRQEDSPDFLPSRPVPAGKRVAPLTIMTVQDLKNLEKSIGHFSLADLLASYTPRECPDRVRPLHDFIAF